MCWIDEKYFEYPRHAIGGREIFGISATRAHQIRNILNIQFLCGTGLGIFELGWSPGADIQDIVLRQRSRGADIHARNSVARSETAMPDSYYVNVTMV